MRHGYLSVENLSASYDDRSQVVNDVSFNLAEGELGCLLGPSGCGKTTILRAISGFQAIDAGRIELADQELSSPLRTLAPEKRNVGMVFQDHALFPHLNIADNIAFGLHQLSTAQRAVQADKMLELVGMQTYRNAYPHEISGGQSQRVALARALAPEPRLLLMDEPFSNLDTALRESLGYEVRQLLKETGITAIMVTHDQYDAFALGDQIGVLNDGKLMQWGSSFNLYHAPKNRFVANFIGDGLFVKGHMLNETTVVTSFGEVRGQATDLGHIGQDIELLLRPDDVIYDPGGPIHGQVERKAFKGAQTLYTIKTDSGDSLLSLVPSHDDYEIGDHIQVGIDADHLVCFSATD